MHQAELLSSSCRTVQRRFALVVFFFYFPSEMNDVFSRKTNLSVSKNIVCGQNCNPFNSQPWRGETFAKSLRIVRFAHPWADKHEPELGEIPSGICACARVVWKERP